MRLTPLLAITLLATTLQSAEVTPDNPVGWRRDGTGRYPEAKPPMHWGRWVKGLWWDLRCQPDKPAGDDPGSARPLDMGMPADWLIVGPFPLEKFSKNLDDEILSAEADAQPRLGDKVRDIAWQSHRISMVNQCLSYGDQVIDFAFAYGQREKLEWQNHPGTLPPMMAYAHTYIHSKTAGKVLLDFVGQGAAKVWLNGQVVKTGPVELKAGWNRLLAKVASSSRLFHFTAHLAPLPPYEYETKNVAWMTRLPGTGWGSPIVVGDRIFVHCDVASFVCLDKNTGRILWVRSNGFYESLSARQKQEFPGIDEKLGPLSQKLQASIDELLPQLNECISNTGLPRDREDAVNKKIKEKMAIEQSMIKALQQVNRHRFRYWDQHRGTSNRTACSDGRHVWGIFMGGSKGMGGDTLACFDLDGKVIWRLNLGDNDVPEHGDHGSPLVVGDRLLFATNYTTYCCEKMTGKVLWTQKDTRNDYGGGSVVRVRIWNDDFIYTPHGSLLRISDGKAIRQGDGEWDNTGTATPCVDGNVIYAFGHGYGLLLPEAMPDGPFKSNFLFKYGREKLKLDEVISTFGNSLVASPLVVDDVLYVVTQGGGLMALDKKTGQAIYKQLLTDLSPRLTWVFCVGVCGSPTLAGKYIYITDNQGQTVIVEPGRTFKQVAKNILMNYAGVRAEENQSTPWFEGDRMYYRGSSYMYCIRED